VDQPTEDIAAAKLTSGRCGYRISTHRWHRRRVGQAAVRPPLVVMLEVASQDSTELLATDDQQVVQALPVDRPDPALSDGIGVERTDGVQSTSTPVERHTSSNALVNFASRSRIRNLHTAA
jgi:hypothetical protein